jgi:predicted dehydrogenase
VEQAGQIARDRGRVVIVGITKVDLPRGSFYEKELDIRFSRSYGPGRYDPAYEWAGNDYPFGYVRWTEQRNFQACLELMRQGKLRVDALTTRHVPFQQAVQVYEDLAAGKSHDVGVVLDYGVVATARPPAALTSAAGPATAERVAAPVTRLDVIGAGNFARTMLLPHLKGRITLGTVANQTPLSASHVQRSFGFEKATTRGEELLTGDGGAVLIATRHHLHAPLILKALAANRHVFVEKPLCLNVEELAGIDAALAASKGSVQVGFNRRFSPATTKLRAALAGISGPRTIAYHVVAGRLDPHSWYANFAESGGRIIGECCHFFDLLCHLAGAHPVRVTAQTVWPVDGRIAFPDSIAAQVEFADGSCGQLIYHGEASTKFPKETVTVMAAGLVGRINNFQSLELFGAGGEKTAPSSSKGHPEQMAAWLEFLAGRANHPLPYAEARRSMVLTFAALRSIQEHGPVTIEVPVT